MATSSDVTTPFPPGIWQVDPAASELGFGARGMFGLVPVHGHFGTFEGTLTVDGAGAAGELQIDASTLDTHNARRDKHLRSADFFDVEAHPTVTFRLTGVGADATGATTVAGVLRIRDNELPIEAPVEVEANAGSGQLKLSTRLDVDRSAAGVGWSKLGMIKGKAQLRAEISLTRQD